MRVSFSAEIGRGPSLDPYPPAPQSHPHDPPRQTQARRAGNHLAAELAARTRELETVKWRQSVIEIGRPTLRVHDLGHTYASLARRAGADLRLLQKTMGASITVTAHIYADLYDDELDDVAWAWHALDDRPRISVEKFDPILAL